MALSIRAERPGDAAAIHALTNAAFLEAPHADGNEADLVDALRDAGALALSLVAEERGELLGHVALSPVDVAGADAAADWFGLGPISVRPARQRSGVGSALMRAALAELRARGAAGCVLLGDPAYYRRFGFAPAAPLVLPGVPPEYFQALAFGGGVPAGVVHYHAAFGVDG